MKMLWIVAALVAAACSNPTSPGELNKPNAMQSCPYEGCKDGNITGRVVNFDYALSW